MADIPLKALGLEKQWPGLVRLQTEVGELEQQLAEAEAEVARRRGEIAAGREKDLNTAAAALRQGKKPPKGTHEAEARGRLESAERSRDILVRAVESARSEYSAHLATHQGELFEDVAAARREIAVSVAEAAREALAGFGKHEDLFYVLKSLAPPAQAVDPAAPARDTMTIIGPVASRSAGPDRGHIEQVLAYLIGLASGPAEGGKDAAA